MLHGVFPQRLSALEHDVVEHLLGSAYDGCVCLLLGDSIEGTVLEPNYGVGAVHITLLSMGVSCVDDLHDVKFDLSTVVV